MYGRAEYKGTQELFEGSVQNVFPWIFDKYDPECDLGLLRSPRGSGKTELVKNIRDTLGHDAVKVLQIDKKRLWDHDECVYGVSERMPYTGDASKEPKVVVLDDTHYLFDAADVGAISFEQVWGKIKSEIAVAREIGAKIIIVSDQSSMELAANLDQHPVIYREWVEKIASRTALTDADESQLSAYYKKHGISEAMHVNGRGNVIDFRTAYSPEEIMAIKRILGINLPIIHFEHDLKKGECGNDQDASQKIVLVHDGIEYDISKSGPLLVDKPLYRGVVKSFADHHKELYDILVASLLERATASMPRWRMHGVVDKTSILKQLESDANGYGYTTVADPNKAYRLTVQRRDRQNRHGLQITKDKFGKWGDPKIPRDALVANIRVLSALSELYGGKITQADLDMSIGTKSDSYTQTPRATIRYSEIKSPSGIREKLQGLLPPELVDSHLDAWVGVALAHAKERSISLVEPSPFIGGMLFTNNNLEMLRRVLNRRYELLTGLKAKETHDDKWAVAAVTLPESEVVGGIRKLRALGRLSEEHSDDPSNILP